MICPILAVCLWTGDELEATNIASINFMEEDYWHTMWQETARGRSSKPALCPACIMADLHIEYASLNLTVTSGEADSVNQNTSCEYSFVTSCTYRRLRLHPQCLKFKTQQCGWSLSCPVMKHGIKRETFCHITVKSNSWCINANPYRH